MADARRFNASPDAIAAIQVSLRNTCNPDTPVWPENVQAVEAFLAISGQWRVYPVSTDRGIFKTVFTGLDYAAAEAGLRLAGIDVEPADWQRVRIMEDEARTGLNGD